MAGFGITLFTILLPVALMLAKTRADITTPDTSPVRAWMDFIGNPIVALMPGVNRALLVLATDAGSLSLSHVNDAGFWLVKQYFGMTLAETFKTLTAMETIISVVGIVLIMLLSLVV